MVQKKVRAVSSPKKRMSFTQAFDTAPEGVAILSFILFVGALMALMFSLWMFTAADEFVANKAAYAQAYQGLNITENTFVNFGILSLIFSFLFYFIGRGFVRLDNRARILLIVLMLVVLVASIYNVFIGAMFYTSIFLIVASAVVLWYVRR